MNDAGHDFIGATLLDLYRVIERLGGGGMADVYRAEHLRLEGESVAVKVPQAELLATEMAKTRFRREIKQLIRLRQMEGIVPILDQGDHKGTPFFVMEYMPGGDLATQLQDGVQTGEEVVAWLTPLADTLDRIHEQGVIHRDVKPANIMFTMEGRPRLSDFGIVKALEGTTAGLTATQHRMYTPGYAAPEQIVDGAGADSISGAADQYALACTVFRALAGTAPFDSANVKLFEAAPDISEHAAGVPRGCAVALARALDRNPKGRYPSCGAFAEAFAKTATATAPQPKRRTSETTRRRPTAQPRTTARPTRPAQARPRPSASIPERRRSAPKRGGAGRWVVAILLPIATAAGLFFSGVFDSGDTPSTEPTVGNGTPPALASDTIAPTITFDSPTGDTEVVDRDRVRFRGRIREANLARFTVNGVERLGAVTNGAFDFTERLQPDTPTRFRFEAADRAGNRSATTTKTVTWKQEKPTPPPTRDDPPKETASQILAAYEKSPPTTRRAWHRTINRLKALGEDAAAQAGLKTVYTAFIESAVGMDDSEARRALGYREFDFEVPEDLSFRGHDFLQAVTAAQQRHWFRLPEEQKAWDLALAAKAETEAHHSRLSGGDREALAQDQSLANITQDKELRKYAIITRWASPYFLVYLSTKSLSPYARLMSPMSPAERLSLAVRQAKAANALRQGESWLPQLYREWMWRYAEPAGIKPFMDPYGGRADYSSAVRSFSAGAPLVVLLFEDEAWRQYLADSKSAPVASFATGGMVHAKASSLQREPLLRDGVDQLYEWSWRQRNRWKRFPDRPDPLAVGLAEYLSGTRDEVGGRLAFTGVSEPRLKGVQGLIKQLERGGTAYPYYPLKILTSFRTFAEGRAYAARTWKVHPDTGTFLLWQQSWALVHFLNEHAHGKYQKQFLQLLNLQLAGSATLAADFAAAFRMRDDDDWAALDKEYQAAARKLFASAPGASTRSVAFEIFPVSGEVTAADRAQAKEAVTAALRRGGRDGLEAESWIVSQGRPIAVFLINELKRIHDTSPGFETRQAKSEAAQIDGVLRKLDGMQERIWKNERVRVTSSSADILRVTTRWVEWWKSDRWRTDPQKPWDPKEDD